MARRAPTRRGWGAIRKLPSGRFQASYVGPDLVRRTAPDTFDASIDAEAWLAITRSSIAAGTWRSPDDVLAEAEPMTLGEYAETWLEHRDLRETTRRIYRHALDRYILPALGRRPLEAVTPADVSRWASTVRRQTGPTQAAHSYGLLRTIYNSAVREDLVPASPCRVQGAGQSPRASETVTLEPAELAALADAAEPSLRALVLLAGWGGLRLGELLELRRNDLNLDAGTVTVRRQVQHLPGKPPAVGEPKTQAGRRVVHLPTHVINALRDHLDEYAEPGRTGLVFPASRGGWRVPSTTRRSFKVAATAVGRPDLRVHDLRHTAAVLAARTGATVAELQARLGHASPAAAMRYQHATSNRDAEIAAALSGFAAE